MPRNCSRWRRASSTESPERRQTLTAINSLARAIAAEAHSDVRDPRTGWLDGLARQLTEATAALERAGPLPGASRRGILGPRRGDGRRRARRGNGRVQRDAADVGAAGSRLADEMRFDMLYDRRRKIFAIGYRLADAHGPGRFDNAFYDLLASEARLASFVAIAKGDVPQHHWFHLGRLLTSVHGRATLMSWSGTMFEYLMPLLLMRNFPGTLLDQSCRAVVRRQIEYAPRAACAVGHLGVRVHVHRPSRCVPVPRVRRARTGAPPRVGRRAGDCTVCHGARGPRQPRRGRGKLRTARTGADGRAVRLLRGARLPSARRRNRKRRAIWRGIPECGPRLLRASPGHDPGGARERDWPRRARQTLSRRSASAGHRTAPSGAGPARSHPVGTAGQPTGQRSHRRSRRSHRDGSSRRTRRARICSSCRTAGIPRRSATPAAGSAPGATSR